MTRPDFKLRFSDIVFIGVFLLALVMGSQMLSLDSDLGRHLTLGNYIIDKRLIPTFDLLSHTRAGLSRPPYEWLSQVLFALAYRLLGLDGVILFASIILAWTFSLLYQYANQRSRSPLLSLIFVFLAAGASSIHWLPRPHIFTFLLLGIWIERLNQLSEGKQINLYTFPVTMLFWANLHGGFIFGILAWTAYFAGWLWDAWRKSANAQTGKNLLIVGITSLIATVITPDLWHNWDAVLNNRSSFILNRTVETMRPNLTDPSILPYTLLLSLTIVVFLLNWKRIKPQHLFLLAGLGLASLVMARNIPLFAIASAPILAEMSAGWLTRFKMWDQIEEQFTGFGSTGQSAWPIIVILPVILFFSYPSFKNEPALYQFDVNKFPVEAADFIEANPQSGNMFNEFNWGGYLEYRLWPRYPVFLDSQSDFYGESLMRDYDQMLSAQGGWKSLLDKYKVDWAIIPLNAPLATALQSEADWYVVYQDNTAIILHKP